MLDRLAPKMTTALEVAVLVRQLDSITDAVRLIEAYAQAVAAGARIEGGMEIRNIMSRALEEPLCVKP